jgi:uncharacterized membrane protein (UPF0127 family)
MRIVGDAKTKSAPKTTGRTSRARALYARSVKLAGYRRVFVVVVVLAAIIALTFPHGRLTHLYAGNTSYRLLVASSDSEQARGLGNRASLPRDEGMLFPSYKTGQQCFWMKDMQFPLDIIWVDSNKKVTHIERNLSPSTYPRNYCALGQYVIELNAGQANASGLKIGDVIQF